MTKSTSGGYDQLEPSPEEIEQEMRTAFCERRQTDLRHMWCDEPARCSTQLAVTLSVARQHSG